MAKRTSYTIREDDPDILHLQWRFGKDIDVCNPEHKRKYLPGTETGTWNSLNLLDASLLPLYLDHLQSQCLRLVSRLGGTAFEKTLNLIPLLDQYSLQDPEFGPLIADALSKTTVPPSAALQPSPLPEDFTIRLEQTTVNDWAQSIVDAWVEVAGYCTKHGVFNTVIPISSKTQIQSHHCLASVALSVMETLSDMPEHSAAIYALVLYRLTKQAESLAPSGDQKKEHALAPDDWIKKTLSDGYNSKAYRSLSRDLFLKGWLYLYTQKHPNTSQTTLIYELKASFEELARMSDSGLKNLLTNLKQPGSLTSSD